MNNQLFFGRAEQVSKLQTFLDDALNGNSQFCFVSGSAGSGKSVLISEFSKQALERDKNIVVAVGNCNAQSGAGDPYLPFLELLHQLTGEVEEKLSQEMFANENAARLKKLMQVSIKTLVEFAPDLINTFIPGSKLFINASKFAAREAGWLKKLSKFTDEEKVCREVDKDRIFQQYSDLLVSLSKHCPLLLIIEDLQWSDASSVNLLFHLSRKLKNSKILFIGSYRPSDIEVCRKSEAHCLISVLQEMKRYFGDIRIDLDNLTLETKKAFVKEFLDRHPNRLGEDFYETFFQYTEGQPLFTVELFQELKDHGDLIMDKEKFWIVNQEIDWDILPSKIEGVIEKRMGRLEDELRDILNVASVEGENFTVQVLSALKNLQERDLITQLSQELSKRHRLVKEYDVKKINGKRLFQFSFINRLFQQFLYGQLSSMEKIVLHTEVAKVLEELYKEQLENIALQLIHHYDAAGKSEKVVEYLYIVITRALKICAYDEALLHLDRALTLVKALPPNDENLQKELKLQNALSTVLKATEGWNSPDVVAVYNRARQLCEQKGLFEQLPPLLFGLWAAHLVNLDLKKSQEIAEECLDLANKSQDQDILLQGHIAIGNTLFWRGEILDAYDHFKQAYEQYDREKQNFYLMQFGQDPQVFSLMFMSFILAIQGHIEESKEKQLELLRFAEELCHPFSMTISLQAVIWNEFHLRNAEAALHFAERLINLSSKHNIPFYKGIGIMFHGWAIGMKGSIEEGIAQIQEGYKKWIARSGGKIMHSVYSLLQSELFLQKGDYQQGLQAVDNGINLAHEHTELCYISELYRLKGDFLQARPGKNIVEAKKCYQKAIEFARDQGAKLFEQRASQCLH